MELAESLEVKVMNCKDLKSDIFSFLQKPSIHVVAAVVRDKGLVVEHDDDDFQHQQQQITPKVVKDDPGGLEWKWNYQMRFHLDGEVCRLQQELFLRFDLRSEFGGILHHVLGDRSVGQVRVPLKDLIQESVDGITRFASYEIRATDGKPNGVLNFSFKLLLNYTEDNKVLMTSPDGDKQHHHHHMVPSPPSSSSSSTSEEKYHHPPPTKSGSESQYRPPLYQLEQLDPSSFQETSLAPLPAMLYPPHHPGYYYPPFPGAPGLPPPALPFSPPPPPPPVPYPSSLTHHAPLHPPHLPPHATWDPPFPPYGLEEGGYGQIGGRGGRAVRWHSHHLPQ